MTADAAALIAAYTKRPDNGTAHLAGLAVEEACRQARDTIFHGPDPVAAATHFEAVSVLATEAERRYNSIAAQAFAAAGASQ